MYGNTIIVQNHTTPRELDKLPGCFLRVTESGKIAYQKLQNVNAPQAIELPACRAVRIEMAARFDSRNPNAKKQLNELFRFPQSKRQEATQRTFSIPHNLTLNATQRSISIPRWRELIARVQ